jgi:pyruvate ferredoxin oxidoreductase beta subunit
MKICKLAVDTCIWPLYEVENGVWKLNYKPKKKLPVTEYLMPQGRFKHLLTDENKALIDDIQEDIDRKWEELLKRCGEDS